MAYNSILENILYVIKMRGEYKAKTCQIFVNLSGFFCVQNFYCSLSFFKKNVRAPPTFDFEKFKIEGREPNGRKRKILYCTGRTSL